MDRSLLKTFASPPSAYRGKPFWAWNGKLAPDELRRQIRLMHRMGLGGFFMHSRVGLDTAYLSDEWFECIDACIDEATRLDMEAWLYDEDRWPSGAAGGLVTCDPKYRMRRLSMKRLTKSSKLAWEADTLAAFTAKVRGNTVSDVRWLARSRRPGRLRKGESILVFRVDMNPPSSWYNGYTYLDTLSHEAVRRFIKVTHEAYRKRCGRHFGRTVPGIFTDEPNYGGVLHRLAHGGGGLCMPWTPKLPQTFKRRYGYDLLRRLPELFFDLDGQPLSQARYHYFDCITHLFVDAFARQIGEWCDKNRLAHTGHGLAEETLRSQTHAIGSAMRFYEHMQAPGMDILTEHSREYDTAKQVSSVARQFDRRWRLTETYGCTGWDFPFAGHKAIGDWQVALGINLRCQHLAWYTMLAEAKRDYPAGIFYQSPWWELYPAVEDYFARVHAVMTRGTEVRDLLVVHPVESMWLRARQGWDEDPEVRTLNDSIAHVRDALLTANIDFDYGDEDILSRHGRVRRVDGEPTVVVGKALYKAVLVPPMLTIRSSTLALLRKFHSAGGGVVFAGDVATAVDAVASDEPAGFAAECTRAPAKGRRLADAVAPTCRRVSIADGDGQEIGATLHLLREDDEAAYLFVCNTGHELREPRGKTAGRRSGVFADTRVRDRTAAFDDVRICGFDGFAGAPVELDPQTGRSFAADARKAAGGWEIRTRLPALGSRLFVVPRRKSTVKLAKRPPLRQVRRQTLGGQRWQITLSEANNLVLDQPACRIGEARRQKPDEVLRVDRAVRDALGIAPRGGRMVQPWARPRVRNPLSIPVSLRYRFEVRAVPGGDLFLAVERPDLYRVAVNGVSLSTDVEAGWWCDVSLRRLPIDPTVLRVGTNEITLDCDYDENHPGLEIVYLLGNFGSEVRGIDVAVTAPPTSLKLGDWVRQGLAFYSGSVSYRRRIRPALRAKQRMFVQVPEYRGVAVRVLVDGESAGVIAWEPNEVDITDRVAGRDAVDLAIEVVGHRRNSHGPFHCGETWPAWTGPGQYIAPDDWRRDGYRLVPCGLMAPPRLVVRK